MESTPKVTLRLDEEGTLSEVEIDGHAPPAELVEERDSEPTPSFGDYRINRNWLAPG